jgi:hypothetical protein
MTNVGLCLPLTGGTSILPKTMNMTVSDILAAPNKAVDDLLDYILKGSGSVDIFGATNSTLARRQQIIERIRDRAGPGLNVLFVESDPLTSHPMFTEAERSFTVIYLIILMSSTSKRVWCFKSPIGSL